MLPAHRASPAGGADGSPGLVVELFGLPGVGKSSFAAELLRASTAQGLRLERAGAVIDPGVPGWRRVGRKVVLALGECARRPLRSGIAARAVLRSQDRDIRRGMPRWLHWLVVQRLLSSALDGPGVHLFDEGALQALWSIGLRGDVAPILGRIEGAPGRWALPHLVVFLDAPLEEIDRRLSARASRHSRVQHAADPRSRRAELERGAGLAARILRWWEGGGGERPVVRVDAGPGTSLRHAASQVIGRIGRASDGHAGHVRYGRVP